MTAKIAFGVDCPPSDRCYVPIMLAKPCVTQTYTVLSARPTTLMIHWDQNGGKKHKGGAIAHREPSCYCAGCERGLSLRFRAYLCWWLLPSCRRALAEITAEGVRGCPLLALDNPTDLRGMSLSIGRHGLYSTSPMWATLALPSEAVADLPATCDEMAALCRIYGLRQPDTPALATDNWRRTPQQRADGEMIPLPPERPGE